MTSTSRTHHRRTLHRGWARTLPAEHAGLPQGRHVLLTLRKRREETRIVQVPGFGSQVVDALRVVGVETVTIELNVKARTWVLTLLRQVDRSTDSL